MENRNFKTYTVQDPVNKMKKLQQKYKQERDKSSRSGTGKRKKKRKFFEIIERKLCDISPSVFFSHFAKMSISFLALPMMTLPVSI